MSQTKFLLNIYIQQIIGLQKLNKVTMLQYLM